MRAFGGTFLTFRSWIWENGEGVSYDDFLDGYDDVRAAPSLRSSHAATGQLMATKTPLTYPRRGLHGEVVYTIGRRIVSGELKPGDPLPPEDELTGPWIELNVGCVELECLGEPLHQRDRRWRRLVRLRRPARECRNA